MRYCGKIRESGAGHRQYNTAHALFILDNKGHTHSEYAIKFFHGDNGCANAAECSVVSTLPISFTQCPSLLENFKE